MAMTTTLYMYPITHSSESISIDVTDIVLVAYVSPSLARNPTFLVELITKFLNGGTSSSLISSDAHTGLIRSCQQPRLNHVSFLLLHAWLSSNWSTAMPFQYNLSPVVLSSQQMQSLNRSQVRY